MKNSFLITQLYHLAQSYPHRKQLWLKLYILIHFLDLIIGYLRFNRELIAYSAPIKYPDKTCAVILLSHNRPQNLDLLVRGALHHSFVNKVVVSNSNPTIHIADWITVQDPRLVLIDEQQSTQPGHRFVLAAQQESDYFLSVDDDIFLSPNQLRDFFTCLLENEAVPHGITGNLYQPGTISSNGSPFHHVTEVDQEVDALIGAYAFTRQHLDRMFAIASALNIGSLTAVRNGEDILLSLTGTGRAQIHNLGKLWLCTSSSLPGVALWQTHSNFWGERIQLFERAKQARLAIGTPWVEGETA